MDTIAFAAKIILVNIVKLKNQNIYQLQFKRMIFSLFVSLFFIQRMFQSSLILKPN